MIDEQLYADDLTAQDFDRAFAVLEAAREHAMDNGYEPEQSAFNDAHYFLQEYQVQCAQNGDIEHNP